MFRRLAIAFLLVCSAVSAREHDYSGAWTHPAIPVSREVAIPPITLIRANQIQLSDAFPFTGAVSISAPGSLTVNGAGTFSGSTTVTNPCTLGGFIYVSAGGCYTTITAAIASFSGGNCGTIYVPVGTRTENITINSSNACSNAAAQMVIQCAGRRSTILKPLSNAAVITIDSTAAGIQGVAIRDCGFDNTATGFTQPAILISGTNINDWHELRRLRMSGFKNSINITGRTVWSHFEDISLENDTDIALLITSATSAVNFNFFKNVSILNAAGAEGALLSCTGTCGGQSVYVKNIFDGIDVEAGTGAGLVLNNTDGTTVSNSYFETNAGFQISATGSLTRGLVIRDSFIHTSNNTVIISVTATTISGEISGNFIANSGAGASTIAIAGGGGNGIFVHGNLDNNSTQGPHTNTADGNSTYHMAYYGAFPPQTITTAGSQTPTVTGINNLHYTNSSAATITNFLGGDPGQILQVFNEGTSTVTFTHANSNAPFMPNGLSVTLANGQSCNFFLEPLNGRWVGWGCTNPPVGAPGSTTTIGLGTATMTAGAVTAATCQAAVTTASTNVATTDAIQWAYATAPTLTTDALLTIAPYVTSGNVNFTRCNPTAASITGTAIVINWRVVR